MLTDRQVQNFWKKVAKTDTDECWLWTGTKSGKGYGTQTIDRKNVASTHIALTLDGRPRPSAPSNHALHSDRCVAPSCVNPRHLRWGTNAENIGDKVRLCRQPMRASHPRVKLTEDQASFIRGADLSQAALAQKFNVSRSTISAIQRGENWASLDGAAVRQGRAHRGDSSRNAKLTEAQALEIKRSAGPATEVAARYGISWGQVCNIRAGRAWAHLPG